MPWYAWLIMVVAIGSIVGGLMMLRDSANKVELTDEQRKRVAERNAQADAKDAQDRPTLSYSQSALAICKPCCPL